MRLFIITAVSRPDNLEALEQSIDVAANNAPDVWVTWSWRTDLNREHIGGQAVKNAIIDQIWQADAWVWALDDDTVAHPDVLRIVCGSIGPSTRAVIVCQQRTDGRVLLADPRWMVPGGVDIGQAFLRRDLIGDHRIPEDYNGDGMFLEAVLAGATGVTYLPAVLSLHNAISGVNVSV